MRKKLLAFVTSSEIPNLYDDDRSAVSAVEAQGFFVEPAIWDSNNVDWSRFDAVIIRSPWDYFLKYEAFLKWLSQLENLGIQTLNPPSVLRENTRKTYLKSFESKGVPIIPTYWIEPKSRKTLSEVLKITGWNEAVLKPSISGGAFRTYRITNKTSDNFESQLSEILQSAEAMIQPLMSTILTEGELSFLFYGGEFSHATIKRAPRGEFRIQRTFGGTVEPYAPRPGELEQANSVLKTYPGSDSLLYARVDMVRDPKESSQLLLVELEATEPNLFFLHDQFNPGAAQRFAAALTRMVKFVPK